jgi:hypothetical protein
MKIEWYHGPQIHLVFFKITYPVVGFKDLVIEGQFWKVFKKKKQKKNWKYKWKSDFNSFIFEIIYFNLYFEIKFISFLLKSDLNWNVPSKKREMCLGFKA